MSEPVDRPKKTGAPVGNQNALRAARWRKAILRALARATNADVDTGLDRAADKFVALVFEGDKWALEELGNRVDGRPVAAIDLGDGELVPTGITLTFVKPAESDERDGTTH